MLLDELAEYLQAQGTVIIGTNFFIGYLPAKPDTASAIYLTGGFAVDGKNGIDEPTVQIRSRSTNFLTAYNNIAAIYDRLQGLNTITLSSGTGLIDMVAMQSAPTQIGLDEALRHELTQNFRLVIRNQSYHRV